MIVLCCRSEINLASVMIKLARLSKWAVNIKKRFFIVNYSINAKGGYDELVELSKKNVGPEKMLEYRCSFRFDK